MALGGNVSHILGVTANNLYVDLMSQLKVLYADVQKERGSISIQDFLLQVPQARGLSNQVLELVPQGQYIRYIPGKGMATMPITVIGTSECSTADALEELHVIRFEAFSDGERVSESMSLRYFVKPRLFAGKPEASYWPRGKPKPPRVISDATIADFFKRIG